LDFNVVCFAAFGEGWDGSVANAVSGHQKQISWFESLGFVYQNLGTGQMTSAKTRRSLHLEISS
jgi:hypothetical protein